MIVIVSESSSEPSLAVTAIEYAPGPWVSVGVQVKTHETGSIFAPAGASSPRLKVSVFAGMSLSRARLGPVFWLMISEIYPLKVRGVAMSVATVANWGFNLAVAVTFLTLIGVLGTQRLSGYTAQ
jgi:hypothetical protein